MEKPSKRRRKLTLAAMILVAALAWQQIPGEPGLLSLSTHVSTLDDRFIPFGYEWAPDGSLVGQRYHMGRRLETFRVDPTTGGETVLRTVETARSVYDMDGCGILSPDRRWRIDAESGGFRLLALGTQAELRVPGKSTPHGGLNTSFFDHAVAWYPDGTRWVELADVKGQTALYIHSLSPGLAREAPVPALSHLSSLIGLTPSRRAVLTSTFAPGVRIVTVPLEPGGAPPTDVSLTPPTGMTISRGTLSPDGRHILWVAGGALPVPWYEDALSRIWPSYRPSQTFVEGLFLSDLDRSEMRVVGIERVPPESAEPPIKSARFTPDGKRASYLFNGKFYTVDVR